MRTKNLISWHFETILVATFLTTWSFQPITALTPIQQPGAMQNLPPPKTFKFQELAAPSNPPSESFSICTYNVLHQELVSPKRYPTVVDTDVVFDPTRRLQLLRQDLKQLQPITDLFCFQEMSPTTYAEFQQELGEDYGSHMVKRQTDHKPLHNALFYRKSKFRLIQHYAINLHDFMPELPKELQDPHQQLEFYAIANHFIVGKQQQQPPKHLLVVTVHLHHDPRHDVVKYAEMSGLLTHIDRLAKQIGNQDDDVRIVIAGDFNAQPSNQVYRLAVLGEAPTLASLQAETMVQPEWLQQRQEWLPLYQQIFDSTPLRGQCASVYAQSKSGGERGHPRYTNLTDGFTNTIDYILHYNKLQPLKLLVVDTDLYEKEDYLPSRYHASDHVLLWAEFELLATPLYSN